MPKEARVAVFEDDPKWLKTIRQELEAAGHKVVLEAQTLAEALNKCITQLTELNIPVAVLDGNLTENDISGYDGRLMVAKIRECAPGTKIIGMSRSRIPGVDVDLGKENAIKLGQTITEL